MRRAALACALAAALACRARPEAAASGAADRQRTLERRLVGEPTTLNGVLQSSAPEAYVLQYVQRNLFDFDAALTLQPSLAESVAASDGGREFVIALRPEAVWEDGRPVTSRDVAFTIRRIVDPDVPAPVFKAVYEDLESVEELDARRVKVRFKRPYAFRTMAFVVPILPEHRFAGKTFGTAADNRAPLSNGPYRFVSWKPGDTIVLERNPKAWGAPAAFDRVVFRILPDNTTAFRTLTAGDLDEDQLDATLKARAEQDPAFSSCCRLLEFYNLDWSYVALNNRSPLFSDPRVRRALTMLSDRAAIAKNLYRGSARVISGPWAPDSPAYDASLEPLPFDPAAAKKLLADAGWKDTNGNGTLDRAGREFEFELRLPAGSEIGRQIDEMLAAELAGAGIRAHVRTLEWSAFIEKVDAGDFEAASLAWSAVDPNPDPYPNWSSTQCPPDGQNNGCYSNPEADRLMDEARRELDTDKRNAIFHRLHRIFRDDAPAIFLVNATQKYGLAKRLEGVTPSPLGLFGTWPGPVGWRMGAAAGKGSGG